MSVKINYLDGGSYTAQNDRALAGALLSPGVLSGFGVGADSPADLAVSVAAGVARVGADGYLVTSDATVPVTIVANTSGYNRIDMIVIDVDDTANPIKALQGIPSSSPVALTPTANQLPLALITVGNNASVINSNVITDDRATSKILAALPIVSGSWTPVIEFATGAASEYAAQQGSYVKIGKLVILSFKVIVSTFSGDSTGYAYITHLPYIPEVTDINEAVVIPYYSGLSKTGPTLFARPSGGWAMVLYENTNSGNSLLTKANFSVGSLLAGTFAYITAS